MLIRFYTGVEKGEAHITADMITSLFRSATRGAAPYNNWFIDGILDGVAFVRSLSSLLPPLKGVHDATDCYTDLAEERGQESHGSPP
jgi:hypothetical protein